MGLAASQARLLTITARKADCEYQSMRYSHQKIALSRDLTDLSTEYQNSLDQTKLVYDFYGTGDTTTPLSYGLLMTPSQMNGYLPTLITDTSGKTVLSSAYATAARAAGIPQEGLGCLPSSTMRNKFIEGLAKSGIISNEQAATYVGIEYAQSMGMGTTDLVTTKVEEMTLAELIDYYTSGDFETTSYMYDREALKAELAAEDVQIRTGAKANGDIGNQTLTLDQILSDANGQNPHYQILCKVDDENDGRLNTANAIANSPIWDWMFSEFASLLNVAGDPGVSSAIASAEAQTRKLLQSDNLALQFSGKTWEKSGWKGVISAMNDQNHHRTWFGQIFRGTEDSYNTAEYIGITTYDNDRNGFLGMGNKKKYKKDGVSVDVSNIAYAYLTYFIQAMEGIGKSEYTVSDTTNNRKVEDSNLITLDSDYKFNVVVNTGVNTDQALQSGFFDAIFNQICTNGWVENNNVTDNDYLQEMLKTGKYFLSTCTDDGYYYQGNYATNTYIKEVTDEDAIAKAEAKYNTEKQKLNQKEEILDLKMKNLDTEISSLTTEYDTIKSLISKNIEKSFKRYDA